MVFWCEGCGDNKDSDDVIAVVGLEADTDDVWFIDVLCCECRAIIATLDVENGDAIKAVET